MSPVITIERIESASAIRPITVVRAWLVMFVFLFVTNALGGKWFAKAEPADSSVESTRIATSLVRNGTFSNPYRFLPTGPSAHVAPGYPAFYAALLEIFGSGRATWWAIRILTIAAYALQLALLFELAARLNLDRRAPLIACVLGCLIPIPGSLYKWEAVFSGLTLVILALLTAGLRTRPWGMGTAALLGATWGITVLISPSLLPVWVVWLPLVWIYARRELKLRATAVVAILPFLVISPWLVRDYRVFHTLMMIRDNFGTELAASNNDCASPWAMETMVSGCGELVHPSRNVAMEKRIAEIGEYRFNVERSNAGKKWILEHPAHFAELCAERFARFWFPILVKQRGFAKIAVAEISLLTLFMAAGLVLMARKDLFAAYLLTSCAAAYSLVYYIVALDLRFRYPIVWISVLAAAYVATTLWTRTSHTRGDAVG